METEINGNINDTTMTMAEDKGKDKKDEKEQDNAEEETPQDDVSVLSENPPEDKSISFDDNESTTLPPPPALCDSDDKDVKETSIKIKGNLKSYKTPSPRRRFSKCLHEQVTPENGEEHKQNSSKYQNTGATDPLENKNE